MGAKTALLVAAGLGVVAFFVFRMEVTSRERQLQREYGNMVPVAMAKAGIMAGAEIQKEEVDLIEIPAKFVEPGAVTQILEEVVGRVAAVPILKGQQIAETKLHQSEGGYLSLRVGQEPERRAITLKLDAEGGMVGLLVPGDLVDVIGVFESAGDVGDAQGVAMRNHAMVLVQATKVLAVDNSLSDIRLRTGQESGGGLFSRSGGGGRSEPASVQQSYLLTLDVTVQEAWKLSLATQIGHVRCVARHRGNTQKQEYGPVPPVTERLKGAEVFGAGGKTIWPSGQPKPEMQTSEAP